MCCVVRPASGSCQWFSVPSYGVMPMSAMAIMCSGGPCAPGAGAGTNDSSALQP